MIVKNNIIVIIMNIEIRYYVVEIMKLMKNENIEVIKIV